MLSVTKLLPLVVGLVLAAEVNGHGMMLDPPSRSSMWRFGFKTPVNYDDNQLFCGGFTRQWTKNGGKCGECGDAWDLPRPRENEDGGKYGLGIISKKYTKGQIVNVTVELTANHKGWFQFRICPNNNVSKPVEQSCLDQHLLQLADGSGTQYMLLNAEKGYFYIPVQLPKDLICSQCVMQWHYHTNTHWGSCGNGTSANGCGPQETFVNCADVAIN